MEEVFVIQGGASLNGSVKVSGSKNAALPIIAATLLCDGPVKLNNIPNIKDIDLLLNLLEGLGADIERNKGQIFIKSEDKLKTIIDEMAGLIRASILLAGPILTKEGSIKMPFPGGCNLGLRKIDLHLKAFKSLGCKIKMGDNYILISSPSGLKGTRISLPFPSVGATENIMMAAACAKGTTIISNCSREPEVADLGYFLRDMGLNINGIGSEIVKIEGSDGLHGGSYSIIPDRIETGTFISATLSTGGNLNIEDANCSHLGKPLDIFKKIGSEILCTDTHLNARSNDMINSVNLTTGPYPEFPTDLQPILVPLLSQAEGTSTIKETIYDNRFQYIRELSKMGVKASVNNDTIYVNGVSKISCADVCCTDLRGGMALVLAGLLAEGTTIIRNIYQIDRGYELIENKLNAIGATIYRKNVGQR
jgi:UDP-N-acetylglucosamine 1-carboxyvinyltransferase